MRLVRTGRTRAGAKALWLLTGLLVLGVSTPLRASEPELEQEGRVLVLKLEGDRGTDPALLRAAEDRLLARARRTGLRIQSEREAAKLISAEAKQSLLGCSDEQGGCLKNLQANVLQAEWIVLGRVTRLGDRFELSLRLVDVDSSRITRQVQQNAEATELGLVGVLEPAIALLLTRPLNKALDASALEAPKPWYARPWVWGGTAGLVAAGAVTFFLLRPPAAGGALGRARLDLP